MLIQPTLEKLSDMRLAGLRRALEEQLANPKYAELSFEDRIGLLVDQEWTRRQDGRLQRRLQHAQFRHGATMEDLDFTPGRGLDRRLVLQLATGEFVLRRLNVIVSGPTGVGKTYLACAVGRSVCKAGFVVRYERLSGLLNRIRQAHGEGSWPDLLRWLSHIELLVIDEWGYVPVDRQGAQLLFRIISDSYERRSLIITTNLEFSKWGSIFTDDQMAAAMIDRLAWASGSRGMAGGQAMDLEAEGQEIDLITLENIHIHKTGALIRASVNMASQAAPGLAPDLADRLDRYAKCLGLAFQIRDDILDIEAPTAILGKTHRKDLAKAKATYPALMGLDAARQAAADLIGEALASLEPFDAKADPLRWIAPYIIERDR